MTEPAETANSAELDRLQTENERMRHELEVMYGGAFDTLKAATDQTALRDRIAEALLDHLSRTADIRPARTGELAFMPEITDPERVRIAEYLAAELRRVAAESAPADTGHDEAAPGHALAQCPDIDHCPVHGTLRPNPAAEQPAAAQQPKEA